MWTRFLPSAGCLGCDWTNPPIGEALTSDAAQGDLCALVITDAEARTVRVSEIKFGDVALRNALVPDPAFARRGVGRLILSLCEDAARAAGFTRAEMMATLAGEPLYAACGYVAIERASAAPVDGVPGEESLLASSTVIPANAVISCRKRALRCREIPAFAGMTERGWVTAFSLSKR